MRRAAALSTIAILLLLTALPVAAQDHQETAFDPLTPVFEFFKSPENAEWVAQFTRDPIPGVSIVTDPVGDFEHSTGETPGYTPDHIDITDAWAIDFNVDESGFLAAYTPTNSGHRPAPQRLFCPIFLRYSHSPAMCPKTGPSMTTALICSDLIFGASHRSL